MQIALVLHLDLAEPMCYTIRAIGEEGSGPRGKFATGRFRCVNALEQGELDRFGMASLLLGREILRCPRDSVEARLPFFF
jgi:hypothetical protein